jgi:hypothetical protein
MSMKKLYAISYKLWYAETSDWGTEYVKAESKTQALNAFAKFKKIALSKINHPDRWKWEEGVWIAEFWNVKQVKEMPCPHCGGKGIVHV